MKLITVMLVLAFLALAAAEPVAQQYGSYCGPGHSDRYGARPIDELDRNCQIYGICVAAVNPSDLCFCEEQLYARLSLYTPITAAQKTQWISALHNAYVTILNCENYQGIAQYYAIAGCRDSACDGRGLTYLPVYPHKEGPTKYLWVLGASNTRAFLISFETYDKFVLLANQFPRNTYQYFTPTEYQEILLSRPAVINVTTQNVLIFVNADGDSAASIEFIENYAGTDNILTKIDEQTIEFDDMIQNLVNMTLSLNDEIDDSKNLGALWKSIAIAFIAFSVGITVILVAALAYTRYQRGQIARHIASAGLQPISMEEPEIETRNKLMGVAAANT